MSYQSSKPGWDRCALCAYRPRTWGRVEGGERRRPALQEAAPALLSGGGRGPRLWGQTSPAGRGWQLGWPRLRLLICGRRALSTPEVPGGAHGPPQCGLRAWPSRRVRVRCGREAARCCPERSEAQRRGCGQNWVSPGRGKGRMTGAGCPVLLFSQPLVVSIASLDPAPRGLLHSVTHSPGKRGSGLPLWGWGSRPGVRHAGSLS